MYILIFPSKIWAKKHALCVAKYSTPSANNAFLSSSPTYLTSYWTSQVECLKDLQNQQGQTKLQSLILPKSFIFQKMIVLSISCMSQQSKSLLEPSFLFAFLLHHKVLTPLSANNLSDPLSSFHPPCQPWTKAPIISCLDCFSSFLPPLSLIPLQTQLPE